MISKKTVGNFWSPSLLILQIVNFGYKFENPNKGGLSHEVINLINNL